VLGNEKDLGIKVKFIVQEKPKGLPEAFILAEEFIKNQSIALILGDNFFYGNMLSPLIKSSFLKKKVVTFICTLAIILLLMGW
jgi:glucose-1-phosphate thymidylyltransferase